MGVRVNEAGKNRIVSEVNLLRARRTLEIRAHRRDPSILDGNQGRPELPAGRGVNQMAGADQQLIRMSCLREKQAGHQNAQLHLDSSPPDPAVPSARSVNSLSDTGSWLRIQRARSSSGGATNTEKLRANPGMGSSDAM